MIRAIVLAASCTSPGLANTPEQVFATAAPSIVVVINGDIQGSGVVVAQKLVATNCHVVANARVPVTVRQGRVSHAAQRAATDTERDLCLLEVPTLEARPVAIGQAASLRVGMPVYAIGAPAGLELSLSAGLVSALRQTATVPMVQTTAPISPGSSGGGLFDQRALLVGITTSQMRTGQNLNFAIPAEWLSAALTGHERWQRCRVMPESRCLIVAALTNARLIVEPSTRGSALAGIARAQAQAGDRQGAVLTLAEAVATVQEVSDAYARVSVHMSIGKAQAQLGDRQAAARSFDTARAAGLSIQDPSTRRGSLGGIAYAQAQAGDITAALITAREIGVGPTRALALMLVAQVQSQNGDRQGASQSLAQALVAARGGAGLYQGVHYRASVIAHIARTHAEAGDRQEAAKALTESLTIARGISDELERAWAYSAIAGAQAAMGDVTAAHATARQFTSTIQTFHDLALSYIVEAQVRAGDTTAAFNTVRLISSVNQSRSFAKIALAQHAVGNISGAIATAENIDPGEWRANVLASIAARPATRR